MWVFGGWDFASMFCSCALLLSKVIKVMNVYFELTPVKSEVPVDPSSFSCDNSNVSHSFYKKLGNTFLKSYY